MAHAIVAQRSHRARVGREVEHRVVQHRSATQLAHDGQLRAIGVEPTGTKRKRKALALAWVARGVDEQTAQMEQTPVARRGLRVAGRRVLTQLDSGEDQHALWRRQRSDAIVIRDHQEVVATVAVELHDLLGRRPRVVGAIGVHVGLTLEEGRHARRGREHRGRDGGRRGEDRGRDHGRGGSWRERQRLRRQRGASREADSEQDQGSQAGVICPSSRGASKSSAAPLGITISTPGRDGRESIIARRPA